VTPNLTEQKLGCRDFKSMTDEHLHTYVIKDGMGHFTDGRSAQGWYVSARSLGAAADVLIDHQLTEWREISKGEWPARFHTGRSIDAFIGVHGPAAMLCAFALESVFKGLAASMRKRPSTDTHMLVRLAADASFPLDDDEVQLCTALTEYAIYLGRYPEAKHQRHQHNGTALGERTFEIYGALFSRAETLLRGSGQVDF